MEKYVKDVDVLALVIVKIAKNAQLVGVIKFLYFKSQTISNNY